MATPVPYNPVPSVGLVDRPLPYRVENVPIGAFGGLSAAARETLGGTESQVGNELYARAIALQQFNQEAAANEKDAAFQQQQIGAFTNYIQKMGKDAGDALPGFLAEQEEIRKQMGAGLSPYGTQLYNNQTRNAYNRIAVSAGFHAAQQQQKYVIGAYDAKVDAAKASVGAIPTEENFNAQMADTEKAIRAKGTSQGQSSDQIDQEVNKAKWSMTSERLKSVARGGEPFKAEVLRQRYAEKGLLDTDTNAALKDYLQKEMDSVGAKTTIANITGGAEGFGDRKDLTRDQMRMAVTRAENAGNPNSYGIQGPVVQSGTYAGQRALGRYQIMPGNLPGWLRQAGMPAMTPEQFLANPAAQDQLFDNVFGGYVKQYGLTGALKKWFTGDQNAPLDRSDGFHNVAWYIQHGNADVYQNMSPDQKRAHLTAIAEAQSPGNVLYKQALLNEGDRYEAERLREQRLADYENDQIIQDALVPGPDGKLITSDTQLPPDAKAALDKSKHKLKWEEAIAANLKRGGYTVTDENQGQYDELRGIYLDHGRSTEDFDKLANFDVAGWHAPAAWRKEIATKQAEMVNGFTKALNAPEVDAAMRFLEGNNTLSNFGIDRKDKTTFNQFRAALSDVMQDFTAEHKRPPTRDDVQEMASGLGQTRTKNWYLGTYQESIYAPYVPDEFRSKIVSSYQSAHPGAPPPTDDYITAAYAAQVYQQLYGKR